MKSRLPSLSRFATRSVCAAFILLVVSSLRRLVIFSFVTRTPFVDARRSLCCRIGFHDCSRTRACGTILSVMMTQQLCKVS